MIATKSSCLKIIFNNISAMENWTWQTISLCFIMLHFIEFYTFLFNWFFRKLAIKTIIYLLSISSLSLAQPDQIRAQLISIEQGLSQSTGFSIVQDHLGFMWFAMQDGLNRYDGYTFKVLRHGSLDSNPITDFGIKKLYMDQ